MSQSANVCAIMQFS